MDIVIIWYFNKRLCKFSTQIIFPLCMVGVIRWEKFCVILTQNSETNNFSWLLDMFSQHRTLFRNTELRAKNNVSPPKIVAFKHDDMRWTASQVNIYRDSGMSLEHHK